MSIIISTRFGRWNDSTQFETHKMNRFRAKQYESETQTIIQKPRLPWPLTIEGPQKCSAYRKGFVCRNRRLALQASNHAVPGLWMFGVDNSTCPVD